MPLFATFLGSLVTGLATFLAQFLSRKVAIATAAIAALATVTGGLLLAFNLAVAPLVASAFSTQYGQFLGLAFPPVAGTCLATYATVWAACVLYRWQVDGIKIGVQS